MKYSLASPHMSVEDDYYAAAQRLADIGLSIIPLKRDKTPAVRWKPFQTKPADEHRLRDWFLFRDDLGIGVVLGDVSQHLCARDFDDRASLDAWLSTHPSLAKELPIAMSRRGGHVYFRSDWIGIKKLGDGEMRGARSYIVSPPSVHPSGIRYRWLRPLVALPRFVDPVEAGLAPQPAANPSQQACKLTALGNTFGVTLETAVADAIRATLPRRFGERNDLIFEFARRLKGIPDLRGRSSQEVLSHAEEWFRSALPSISTKEWRVTRAAFISAWPRITHPLTDGTLRACLADVDASIPSPIALRYLNDGVAVRLIGLCERLQQIAGADPFFLSTEACCLFGLKHKMQLHRRLTRLVGDGVLKRLTIGNSFQRRASTYLYLPTIERMTVQ